MRPTRLLRLEGLAVAAGALAGFVTLDGPWWLLVALVLAPDLSMLAYLGGPRVGSWGYNLAHTYVIPLTLAGLGLWTGTALATLVALVWMAHIGVDRLAGFGLKYATGFKDTHLGRQPPPVPPLEPTG